MALRVIFDISGDGHRIVDDRKGPLGEANGFLKALEVRGLSPDTIRAYAFDLLAIYRWLERVDKRLLELRECDLVGFIAEQRESDAAPRSINRRLNTCQLAYRFWADKDMERGPGVSAPGPYYKGPGRDKRLGLHKMPKRQRLSLRVKVPKKIVEPLIVEQVETFLESLKRYRDLAITYLMLLCGLRSREVLTLTVSDVWFDENRLRIHGKGDKERCLPLPEAVVETLSAYLRLERPSECPGDSLFVVLQGKRRGQAMTRSGLRSLFRHRRSAELSVANANPHRWRHTFGTDMARAGVRLPTLQKMMGHASSDTTLQYINLSMADIADEYRRAMTKIQQRYQRSAPL